MAWLRTNRRLRTENSYLRLRARELEARPALIVTPGPRPAVANGTTSEATPPPYDVEELLRGQLRTLRQLKTVAGAAELADQVRMWRTRASALDERLLDAQRANESLTDELRRWTGKAVAAEAQLRKVSSTAERLGLS